MATKFPAQSDTTQNLYNIADLISPAVTTQLVSIADTTITVNTTTGYPNSNGLIVLGNEQILYTNISGNSFTGCLRGLNGTVNVAYPVGTVVQSIITASAYTNLRDAILQIETLLGLSGLIPANFLAGSTGTGPIVLSSGATLTPNFIGIGTAADNSARMVAAGQYFSSKFTITWSATPTVDWNNGNVQRIVLAGSTGFTFTNPKDGARYLLAVKQDGTGNRTASWPGTVKWNNGLTPTLTGGPNKSDLITLVYDGTDNIYYGMMANNF
jgi:hypothetical protein